MIQLDADTFGPEIAVAVRQRDKHIASLQQMIRAYSTPAFRNTVGFDPADPPEFPENHYFEYVGTMAPFLANNLPRLRVRSRRGGEHAMIAREVQFGLHAWMDWMRFLPLTQEMAIDFLFGFASTEVREIQMPPYVIDGTTVEHVMPQAVRIPQERFLMDPAALDWRSSAWTARMFVVDQDELVDLARRENEEWDGNGPPPWNLGAIRNLDQSQHVASTLQDRRNRAETQDLKRREVVGYDVWVRDFDDEYGTGDALVEDGYNGGYATFLINDAQSDSTATSLRTVRRAVPFFGPENGPFIMHGAFFVPGHAYPLAPLQAVEGQVRELNMTAVVANRSVRKYKKLVIVSSQNEMLEEYIHAPDLYVIPVQGFTRDEIVEIELGGVTDQSLAHLDLLRDRLSRNSGQDDAQRGNVTGQGTATEHEIAQSNASVRNSYIRGRYQQMVVEVLDAVAHYMHHDEDVTFPLGEDAERALGQPEPWFNGKQDPSKGYTARDIAIEIETGSMQQTNDLILQRRVMQGVQMLQAVVEFYVNTRGTVDGRGIAAKLGDALNMPELPDMVDWEQIDQMVAQAEQQAQSAIAQQGSAPREQGSAGRAVAGSEGRGVVDERNADRRSLVSAV